MVPDLSKITGLGEYAVKNETIEKSGNPTKRSLFYRGEKVFLVINEKTLEVRCDDKLSNHLKTKYESVMESRYFGRGGIEIIPAGQLTEDEIADLIRLSYNLSV